MSHKSTGQLWWWIAAAVRLGVAEVPRRRPAQRRPQPNTQKLFCFCHTFITEGETTGFWRHGQGVATVHSGWVLTELFSVHHHNKTPAPGGWVGVGTAHAWAGHLPGSCSHRVDNERVMSRAGWRV